MMLTFTAKNWDVKEKAQFLLFKYGGMAVLFALNIPRNMLYASSMEVSIVLDLLAFIDSAITLNSYVFND
ncbi:hypothetical protein LJB83_01905 [Clostridia bacterium OttesenSCG-928-F22]|nr:hypothetical protein [Clostridia bacterium OttesenSCG-928-F22]